MLAVTDHAETRSERVLIRLRPTELEALDRLAAREQRTRSDMARVLINRGTEQQ